MAQRISRAKATIKAPARVFELPPDAARGRRLASVLHVLYLIFNEGYTASSGPRIQRVALAAEAIRLTRDAGTAAARRRRSARAARADAADPRPARRPRGARRSAGPARRAGSRPLGPRGDRRGRGADHAARWRAGPVGPYQLQAAIAAVHAEAPSAAETDWRQITVLYELLERIAPNPMFTLNRAVAVAMFRGPEAGLELLATVERDDRLAGGHRVDAVRGHLLEMAGDAASAAAAYETAAALTTSLPERRYLQSRAMAARSVAGAPPRDETAAQP